MKLEDRHGSETPSQSHGTYFDYYEIGNLIGLPPAWLGFNRSVDDLMVDV